MGFNYLIGSFLDVPADYDYKNRPDPDSNGCKKLYDDMVSLFFSDYDAINLAQQFHFKGPLWKNKIAWDKYEKLNNRNPAKRTNLKCPPSYNVKPQITIFRDFFDRLPQKIRVNGDGYRCIKC